MIKSIDTEERRKALKVREALARELDTIGAKRNLNREGRAAQVARAWTRARDELAKLQRDEATWVADSQARALAFLFGSHGSTNGADVIASRDAIDRASKVETAADAAKLMNQAELHGDAQLMKAVAREAYHRRTPLDSGWNNLFQQWAGEHPGAEAAVEELTLISDERTDATHRMNRERSFSLGPLPAELRGVGNLAALAEQADAPEGELPPTMAETAGAYFARGLNTSGS